LSRFLLIPKRSFSNIRVPIANAKQRGNQPKKRQQPPASSATVLRAFLDLHQTLEKGLRDMSCEVNLNLNRQAPTIEVVPNTGDTFSGMTEKLEGQMVVLGIADDNNAIVTMQSPASNGMYRYSYDEESNQFIAEDKHELIGMLCRDLLWNCKGMPKF
jgi:hypothetical protein